MQLGTGFCSSDHWDTSEIMCVFCRKEMELSVGERLYSLGLSSRIPMALAFQNGCEVVPVHRVYLILSVRLNVQ